MKGQGRKLGLCFVVADLVATALSWLAAYWLRFYTELGPPAPDGIPPFDWCWNGIPLILLLGYVSCRVASLYQLDRLRLLSQELPGVLRANALLGLLLIAVVFYRKDPYKSRLVVAIFLSANVAAMLVMRRAAWGLIHHLRGRGINPSPAIIIGTGRMAQRVAETLEANTWTGLESLGFIDAESARSMRIIHGLPVLGTIDEIAAIIERNRVAYVFIALPITAYSKMRNVMQQLSDLPVDVRLVPDVPNVAAMCLTTTNLGGLPIIGLRENPHDGVNRIVKRAMDVVVASIALVLLAPVLAVIALAIKLTSRGPVLYRQERVGLGGEPFWMYKFRSMRVDAEAQTGAVWAVENDSRRTLVGRFLRRSSLDELPQLFNVLRGEMSLVGPRPERPVFIEEFRETIPHYMLRHAVKAGITGWAQVHGWRGNTSLRKRVQYDLHYIAHWSLWLDLRILFLTVLRGMVSRNAY